MLKIAKHAIRDVFVPVCLLLLPFALPLFTFSFDVATYLTVVSLIFAILAGFFFAAATSNYLRLQTLIADDNAGLISLYRLARLIDPKGAEHVSEAVDRFMIRELDFELLDSSSSTDEERAAIMMAVDALRPVDERGMAVFGFIHERMEAMQSSANEIDVATKTIVGRDHWTVLIILSVLVLFLTYALRDGSFIAAVITAAISAAVYLSLRLLHAVDTNLFLTKKLAFEDPRRVFSGVGKLPYYPEYAFSQHLIPRPPVPYRVGIKHPDGRREVRVVER